MFAPDPEQRSAMVHFRIPPQPHAALSAPSTLDSPQELHMATRSRTATRLRKRYARPRSCWVRCSKGQRATLSDKPVGRTRSKILALARARVHGTVRAECGT